jgi:hypothetical protein
MLMVVHGSGPVKFEVSGAVYAVATVRTREELARALRRDATQIVIDNRALAFVFLLFLSVQTVWGAQGCCEPSHLARLSGGVLIPEVDSRSDH